MKNILLITPTSGQVVGFRQCLIEALQKNNYNVSILTLDDQEREKIERRGIDFHCIYDQNRSLNPFKILSLSSRYAKAIREINPDKVFTFMLKPNTFGVLGAVKAGYTDIYSMVEGTGDPFTYNTFKWRIIRAIVSFFYKRALKHSKRVFFLNNDDKQEFVDRGLVKTEQCDIVHGIGVDIEKFDYRPIKNNRTFIMIARMLETKGVYEYCECARRVKEIYPDAVFNYLGAEGTVKLSDIQSYIDDGSINYLGTTQDVRPYIEDATALVLPTYKEGMPVTVMEAESLGRAVIVSDTNGCRDTIVNGDNGWLFPLKDVDALVDKVIWCIEHPTEVIEMGKNARCFAEEHFDSRKINKKIIGVLNG